MENARPASDISNVLLRDVVEDDLPIFFEQQLDADANHMAAFTVQDPTNREAFMARWARIRADETIITRTLLFNGQVAGSISLYKDEDQHQEVTYWLGKPYWGQGLASRALSAFLKQIETRPLYARVAQDNRASLRVLEKNGFVRIGENRDFANARHAETDEFILRLDAETR